ncbi:hypothetical protein [Streptomyces rimosus]|uniref:hypothetical protein n=1 Tax=Streptomyces rimosus TaxID=1927 RepID=UPI0004CBEF35|nr:hypothetical protein [Streptomyces rimosus]
MKIRRALTAAAAAAVIAPAAVLTVPTAAFATGPGATASGTTGSADTAATAGGGAEGSGESGGKGGGTGSAGTTGSTGTGGSTAGTAGTGGTTAGTGGSAGTGGTGNDKGTATGGGGTSGETESQTCDFESDQLRVTVNGLPSQLVAGGSWTSFTMRLSNTTGKTLTEVQPFLHMSSAEDVDRPYWELDTEYRDRRTGEWKTFHDASPQTLFGSFAIGPRSVVTLTLRTRVVKDAKPGTGYALASGDFRNRDGSCGSAKEEWYDFAILSAGGKPTDKPGKPGGGTAEPTASAEPGASATPGGTAGGSGSGGGVAAQGGGHLAATGSSAALPVIGLAGAAAIAVGAGAVFAVRRRKPATGTGRTDATA